MGKKIWRNNSIKDLPEEIWLPVPNADGYAVSTLGRVKSLARWVNSNGGTRFVKDRVRLQGIDLNGYLTVGIRINNIEKVKIKKVHLLVAAAFILPDEKRKCINHINGCKQDNRVENLERVTHSENMFHAVENNLQPKKYGQDIPGSKMTNKQVLTIFKSKLMHRQLAEKYGVCRTTITLIKNGKNWSHVTGKKYERKY